MTGGESRVCLNCGSPLTDQYCARCGQQDIEPRVSVRDFIHELAAEHLGLDSKVARTLLTLVRHPGRLTREFFAGRRVRYLPPLRLYLSVSVIYFLLSAFAGDVTGSTSGGVPTIRASGDIITTDTTARATDSAGSAVASAMKKRAASGDTTAAKELSFLQDTLRDNAATRFVKRRASQRIEYFRAHRKEAVAQLVGSYQHDLPDALFLLVPALAFLLLLLYRRPKRYYAEHLVFALHFQSVVFVAFILTLLPIPAISSIVFVSLVGYMFVSLRVVYGESRMRTTGKLAVLSGGYLFSALILVSLLGVAVFLIG